MRRLMNRSRVWVLMMSSGASLTALEACDPTVRDTVLTGVGDAATSLTATFIQAFFESLLADEEGDPTTVRGFDVSKSIFA